MAKKPVAKTPPAPTYPVNPALEAAVIAHAEEDTPRLVYADWLDENGDPDRAAYIRNEVALWDKNPADPDYQGLIEKRLELRVQIKLDRLEPTLPSIATFHDSSMGGRDDAAVAFHRGFPYFANEPYVQGGHPGMAHAVAYREALQQIVSGSTIRGLYCHGFWQYFDTVLDTPAAKQLSAISCYSAGSREDGRTVLDLIARSQTAPNLAWLELSNIDPARDLEVLQTADFRNLYRLESNLTLPKDVVGNLLEAPWFRRLRRVRFNISAAGGKVCAALGALPELHTIESNQFLGNAIKALETAGPFRALGRFSIRAAPMRGAGVDHLSRAKMPRLAVLRLAACGLRNDDLRTLCNANFVEQLRAVDFQTNEIGDRGMQLLGASAAAKRLRLLSAGDNPFGKSGLLSIAKRGAYPELTTLDLNSSVKRKTTESDVTRFLEVLELPELRHLDLNGWPVSDKGARALAANSSLANLRWLSLGYCQIGRQGLLALAESRFLRNVVYLFLTSNPCAKSADVLLDPDLFPNLSECWITSFNDPLKLHLQTTRPNVRWF